MKSELKEKDKIYDELEKIKESAIESIMEKENKILEMEKKLRQTNSEGGKRFSIYSTINFDAEREELNSRIFQMALVNFYIYF